MIDVLKGTFLTHFYLILRWQFTNDIIFFKLIKIKIRYIVKKSRNEPVLSADTSMKATRYVTFYHVRLNKLWNAGMELVAQFTKNEQKECLIENQKLWLFCRVVKSINLDTCRIQFICARYMALLNT